MNKQLIKDNGGARVSGEKIEISLNEEAVYIMKYPKSCSFNLNNEDFVWSVYNPKYKKTIELRFQNTERGMLWFFVANKKNGEYINNFGKRLEKMLADAKRFYKEYHEKEKEIDNFYKEVSNETITRIPWTQEMFNEIYNRVRKQNKLEQDANKKYEEIWRVLEATSE